tara:strand:+ start:22580 stop:24193 length:1614 start_codon:yes stop_codon:yes gene_type:complete
MNMKKRRINWSVVLLALFVAGIASCSADRTREEKVSAIIGKIESPFFVMNMTPGNIIEKSGATDGALPYTLEMLLGFFIDEEITGVDYSLPVQIIMGKGGGYTPKFYGIYKLKDEVAFKELLETEANATISEKDGFQYVLKESDNYVLVWDEDIAIATSIPMDLASVFSGGSKDGMKTVDKTIELIKAAEEGEVNEFYQTFLENTSDIVIRFEGEPFYSYAEEMSMGMSDDLNKNKDLIEGVNCDMFINFTNGSVDMKWVGDLSTKLLEKIDFMGDGPVNSELFSFGNSENPMFTLAYNVDLKKGLDFSKDKMSDREYNDLEEELNEMGVSLENAKTGLTGDILFIVDHVEMKTTINDWGYGDPYESKEAMPIFGLVLGIDDIGALSELAAASDSIGDGILQKGEAFIVISDEILFSTNDSLWAVKVKNGTTSKVPNYDGVLSSEPFGMFLDLSAMAGMDDLDDAEVLINQLQSLEGIGDMNEINISLIMKDNTRNALRILTETIGGMTEEEGRGEEYDRLREELEEAAAETENREG